MIDTAKMSDRGQIIIPKSVRDLIGADNGTIFAVSAVDKDTVVMKKLDTDKFIDEFRRFRRGPKKLNPREIEEEIRKARSGP